MRDHTSRLKNFDSGSMSVCTPHALGVRALESFPLNFKRWFPDQHSSQSKVSVENVVSDYGFGYLLRWVGANPEPVRIDNPISAHFNSISTWTFDFTGRVSIFTVREK